MKGKHKLINWLDKSADHPHTKQESETLVKEMNALLNVSEIQAIYLINPNEPLSAKALADALTTIAKARRQLPDGAQVFLMSDDQQSTLRSGLQFDAGAFLDGAAVRTKQSTHERTLIVRKPDYIRETSWQFVHEGQNYRALFEDEAWLKNFHARKFELRPKDALLCTVREERHFSDGNMTQQSNTILKVHRIVKALKEHSLF